MVQRIIYPNDSGGIVVLICHRADGTPLTNLPLSDVARKDVPVGVPYRFVDESEIPIDRSQRDLWTADFSEPEGHGIGAEAWLAEQAAIAAEAEEPQE
ncbi:hypothetical protein GGQ99_004809 [Aminobacter niigataensis]|uniref:Uncharacterized protein n=1 Tax=Aminobacter niigataensis TaxID=83265 RepID=A0ABR6LAI7_9HYPH|nr:hypothetical protein [Aminobacter niigataensis]MBB4653025.1 hypothetical protein [Aminobacter niigataensis]